MTSIISVPKDDAFTVPHLFTHRPCGITPIDRAELGQFLSRPPFGRSEALVRFTDITRGTSFRRSGAAGWTYFPFDHDGSRLARVSFYSDSHCYHLNALVRLTLIKTIECDPVDGDEEEVYRASEFAVVTLDNLTLHGSTLKRNRPKMIKIVLHSDHVSKS